jgi:hypothetical protein
VGDEGGVIPATGLVGKLIDGGSFIPPIDKTLLFSPLPSRSAGIGLIFELWSCDSGCG